MGIIWQRGRIFLKHCSDLQQSHFQRDGITWMISINDGIKLLSRYYPYQPLPGVLPQQAEILQDEDFQAEIMEMIEVDDEKQEP